MISRVVLKIQTAQPWQPAFLSTVAEEARGAVDRLLAGAAEVSIEAHRVASEPWTIPQGVPLSRAEKRIAWYIAQGMKRSEVALRVKVRVKTFDSHRLRVLAKLRCTNEVQLARLAIREGWIEL